MVGRSGVGDSHAAGQIPEADGSGTGLADRLNGRLQQRTTQISVVILVRRALRATVGRGGHGGMVAAHLAIDKMAGQVLSCRCQDRQP